MRSSSFSVKGAEMRLADSVPICSIALTSWGGALTSNTDTFDLCAARVKSTLQIFFIARTVHAVTKVCTMVEDRKRPAKTETLTIRLDPKVRFIMDFLARYHGQTITAAIERSVTKAASEIDVSEDEFGRTGWMDLWDTSEGVRALRVARQPKLFPSYEEERRASFAREHAAFFYVDYAKDIVKRGSIDVLWPRIDEFVEMHDENRHRDYWAAGKAMAEALKKAGLVAPSWPPPPPPAKTTVPAVELRVPKKPREDFSADLDDEIPF